jgi:hypothetical protein
MAHSTPTSVWSAELSGRSRLRRWGYLFLVDDLGEVDGDEKCPSTAAEVDGK